jgi:N-acetylglucosamine malate deacetylase 2
VTDLPIAFPSEQFTVVVAVCAHPDDEAFGLGAIISTLVDSGTEVRLVCLTRGEVSTLGAAENLAIRRGAELHCATEILGIAEVHLHDYPDGGLGNVSREELAGCILSSAEGADALLVFDDGGITGHPDHQAATDAAVSVGRIHAVPVLAWAFPEKVAGVLRREFGGGFVGREWSELDFRMEVDRRRQRDAIRCHSSQANPVPERRLELQGSEEFIRRLV